MRLRRWLGTGSTMSPTFDLRTFVAIDMHGARGGALRRHLVRIEFPLAIILAATLGGYLISDGGQEGWISGLWLLGIATNYVPLTFHAVRLSRPGQVAAALASVEDLPATRRHYSIAQVRLLVPYWVAVLAMCRRSP